jgi:hypothetical protein
MTRPGALESKKRCHDLSIRSVRREIDYKKYAFSGRARFRLTEYSYSCKEGKNAY